MLEEDLKKLFPGIEIAGINKLLDGEPDQAMAEEIGKRIKKFRGVLTGNIDHLSCILSTARSKFKYQSEEPVIVSTIIMKYTTRRDVPLYAIDYSDRFARMASQSEAIINCVRKDLGSNCLVSLSFFYPQMQKRHERRSAPEPEFYRRRGIESFEECRMPQIANNFENWENFIRENLADSLKN